MVSFAEADAIAAAEVYRAHRFEIGFLGWLNKQVASYDNDKISHPKLVKPVNT
jgi:hypothetical protein